jgi:hypothetical protein
MPQTSKRAHKRSPVDVALGKALRARFSTSDFYHLDPIKFLCLINVRNGLSALLTFEDCISLSFT